MFIFLFIYCFLFLIRKNLMKQQNILYTQSSDLLEIPQSNLNINESINIPPGSYPFGVPENYTTKMRLIDIFNFKKKLDYLVNKDISINDKKEFIDKEKNKISKLNITAGGLYNDWDFIF